MTASSYYLVFFTFFATIVGQHGLIPRKPDQFRILYQWKSIEFAWPDNVTSEQFVNSSSYDSRNILVTGMKYYKNRLYLALPRLRDGVPTTLAYIPAKAEKNYTSPLLTPYPSLELNTVGDCKNFQSVHSFEIDLGGTMWIIDTGKSAGSLEGMEDIICPPCLIWLDIDDVTKIDRYIFPDSVANENSYLRDIVLDDSADGYAYITDSGTDPGIIVYSKRFGQSWKARDAVTMIKDYAADHFFLNGTHFDLAVNIDGIAIGPRYMNVDGIIDRNVYYSPLSSFMMHYIQATELRKNPDVFKNLHYSKLVRTLGVKPSQTAGMIMDEEGFLYYGLIGNYSIAQWNSLLPFSTQQRIVAKDSNYIQWPERFSFDEDGNLYVLVNRRQRFETNSTDLEEINLRILKSNVGSASYMFGPTKDEVCEQNKKRVADMKKIDSSRISTASRIFNSIVPKAIALILYVLFVL